MIARTLKRFSLAATAFAALSMLANVSSAQVLGNPNAAGQNQANGNPGAGNPANGNAANGAQANGTGQRRVEPGRPFAPPSEAAQGRLTQLLAAWEKQSQGTKNLTCEFTRWHFNNTDAPAGVHATWAHGSIKYAAPDKGLFRVDVLKAFKGFKDGKPVYESDPKNFGEYWVCNGSELIEFDRTKKECKVQVIPPEMRGQKIFASPLPFVFNLDAEDIQNRYWIREVPAPDGKTGVYVLEAWPKQQVDRAQYRLVKIVISGETFLPESLLIYAPNFDLKDAPIWDHYNFSSMKRNAVLANLQQFIDTFIKARPPSDWKVVRENFGSIQQAAAPQDKPIR